MTEPINRKTEARKRTNPEAPRMVRKPRQRRNVSGDISWLRDTEVEAEEHLTEPEDIAAAIIGHLEAALEEIEAVSDELTEEEEGAPKPTTLGVLLEAVRLEEAFGGSRDPSLSQLITGKSDGRAR